MKKYVRLSMAAAITCSVISTAGAEETITDKVAAGHEFALQVCSACHVVAEDQDLGPTLQPPAPSFSALARNPKISETFLRRFLSKPHGRVGAKGKMPNPQLLDYQIDKIVAYFLSLKGSR